MSGRNVGLKGARSVGLIFNSAAFRPILAVGWALAWLILHGELVFCPPRSGEWVGIS